MHCLRCGFETTNPKFCSRSCSASYTNARFPKRKPEGKCKSCSSQTNSYRTYCQSCWAGNSTLADARIDSWLSGEWDGRVVSGLSKGIRNFLLRESNFCCSKCGFNTPHPIDGKSILEINHIDGNGMNNKRENLEVLCPNCHALTPSYRGRNYGKGKRAIKYIRITKNNQ